MRRSGVRIPLPPLPWLSTTFRFTEWRRDDRLRHPSVPGSPVSTLRGGCLRKHGESVRIVGFSQGIFISYPPDPLATNGANASGQGRPSSSPLEPIHDPVPVAALTALC